MDRYIGEILEFGFGDFQYNLAVLDYGGIPAAVFVVYNELEGCWHGMDVPMVLRKFPELLEQFAQALALDGLMLLAVPSEEGISR